MLLERVNPAATAIVGVFQADQPRANVVGIVNGPDGGRDVFEPQDPAVASKVRAVTPESRAIPPASHT